MDLAIYARESYGFWIPKTRLPLHTFALLGNEDGETSFRPGSVGDKGQAFGPFQHHLARIEAIAAEPPYGAGIDIRTASHVDQLAAAFWEMQHGAGYRRVWDHLNGTTDIEDAVAVLVREYEQSASQERDIFRRTAYAKKWAAFFGEQS